MTLRQAISAGYRATTAVRSGGDTAAALVAATAQPVVGRDPVRDLLRLRARLRRAGARPDRDENVFLTAALRALGHDATLVLGREIAPAAGDPAYRTWVRVHEQVLSTGLPVEELYTVLAVLPERAHRTCGPWPGRGAR